MEKYKTVIIVNIIAFGVFGLFMSSFGLAGVGAAGVVIGVVDIVIALLTFVFSSKTNFAQGCLLCGGILLLIGFSLCSTFPLNLH